jgi:putative methyltransferase
MSKKTIVIYNPIRFNGEAWLPVFWAQAKTYYERHGLKQDEWNWAPCYADSCGDKFEEVKEFLLQTKPDVFAVSLYIWNYPIVHQVAEWVREQMPNCLIISGGPHQYFKHDQKWFKEHKYLDASLPGECYGELCIQEILDNYDNGKVDWDQVSDICYPKGKSRLVTYSTKTMSRSGKKDFDYNWSAFSAQLEHFKDFIAYHRAKHTKPIILSIIETTRGCPYGCTYCDWGGGISTTVKSKDLEIVKQDIDALCQLNLHYIYFADANFGIFGDRDIAIIKYLAEQRKQQLQTFNIGYGGFAKTENRMNVIKQILEIDIKNKLSIMDEIKISMQSLDKDVLHNIDRKNIPLDVQYKTLKSLFRFKKMPIYVELINGLPGMTTDKFYTELNELGTKRLSIQWYPWMLLPEAPAYGRAYREKYGIETTLRTAGGWSWIDDVNSHSEIVVACDSFTKDDYLEMTMSGGMYKLIVQGGYYEKSIKWLEQNNIQIGDFCKDMFHEFYMEDDTFKEMREHVYDQWHNVILNSSTNPCFVSVPGSADKYYTGHYFIALAFLQHERFTVKLGEWMQRKYGVPSSIVKADNQVAIHSDNFGKTKWAGLFRLDYRKKLFNLPDNLNKVILQFLQFRHSGHIVKAKKKLFGLL